MPFCYEIPEAGGSGFAPYTAFNTTCWEQNPTGQAYARQPIESVKFQVPGDDTQATPFEFCVGGFADAQDRAGAPTDIPVPLTPIRGTMSGQFDRAKVLGANGESYIVQNNAWGETSRDRNAIGFHQPSEVVTIDNRRWRVYAGGRAEASDGTGGNAPVISYVNEGPAILDYSFDLNLFIRNAVQRSQMNQLNGLQFPPNLFLTDIFAGFEIWGGGTGLRIEEFSAVVR